MTESWYVDCVVFFFFSSRRRHTRYWRDWSSDVCSSDLAAASCNFITTLASIGTGDGQVLGPRGIATDSAGNVYVADQNTRVQKFSAAGVFQFKFATGGSSAGAVVSPFGVAVNNTSGDIYVTDGFPERTSGHVQRFNSAGVFQNSWGTQGGGNGQFVAGAGGVAVDSAGNVYVADPGNHRVQKFTSSGSYLRKWGTAGAGNGQFAAPTALTADGSGNIYVADTGNSRIQTFDSVGTFLNSCGSAGSGNNEF